ncbi:MAG TPA: DnaJ C-terminal domain-containing protein [Lautropia sp.]|nr:DnaJ C-terminal domain-containing protein [Lautropia sp.]
MKYKDYYAALGVERNATEKEIKTAYQRLARKFHPDVSKEAGAEERFKEIAEAYQTLKDPEKRAAYDELGRPRSEQDFQPPPGWSQKFSTGGQGFDDVDLADLFAQFGRSRPRGARPPETRVPGQDYEVSVDVTLEQAVAGATLDLSLKVPEADASGITRPVPRTYQVQIPAGTQEGQRLRLTGKGGRGISGGRDGDLYLTVAYKPHPLFRVEGADLYFDLSLAPWEAVLGTTVKVPTLTGEVDLRVAPVTPAGRKLRLAGRGLPRRDKSAGDLYAVVRIVVPPKVGDAERALYQQLADASQFNPRAAG